jgi:hypothetical protein
MRSPARGDIVADIITILEEETKEAAIEATEAAVAELEGDGLQREEAIDLVFNLLDSILAFKEIGSALAGPGGSAVGVAAEVASDAALGRLKEKAKEWQRDPEKIEERASQAEARGHHKVAARRRERAARIRARQE